MPRYKPSAHAEGDDSGFRLPPRADDEPEEILETVAERAPEPPPPSPPPVEAVTVIVLADHVYLPRDATISNWAISQDTVRVDGKVDGRRTRVDCHPTLAKFLQERGQAEIL
jgi:hypothetical protein